MGELRKIYQAMEQKEYSPGEVLTYARQLMRDVLDKSPGVLVELDDTCTAVFTTPCRNSSGKPGTKKNGLYRSASAL